MPSKRSPVRAELRLLSTHAAAGLATLLLALPLILIIARAGEPVGSVLMGTVLAMLYVVLFLIYRALAAAATIRTANAPSGEWVSVISAVAVLVAGIIWLVWVWQMRPQLASPGTYAPLLIGMAFLWATLAAGALVQRHLMRDGSRRVAI